MMKKQILSCAALCAGLFLAMTGCTSEISIGEMSAETSVSTISSTTATSAPAQISTTIPATTVASSTISTTVTSLLTSTALIATIKTNSAVTKPTTVTTTTAPSDLDYKNQTPQQILDQMTLEQKVAQMLMISCHSKGADTYAAKHGAGALCLYADAFANKSKQQVCNMTANLQELSELPLLISVDEEGGGVTRISSNPQLRASKFLRPAQLYANGGWELVTSDTLEKAQLLLSLGVNVNLAPVCDIPLSKNDYIYNRCFSMNAEDTSEYATRVVSTMKQQGIGSTLKHFPGYGGSADTHKGMGYDTRPYSDFQESDLKPFKAGIQAGADSVLVSHNIVKCMDANNPASLSFAVHDLLRNTIGFQGVIITDDLGMDAIIQFCGTENAAVKAVEAGNDLLCCPNFDEAYNAILKAAKSGRISESRINASVLRILQWKQNLSLLD